MWYFLLAVVFYILYRLVNKKTSSNKAIKPSTLDQLHTYEKKHTTISPRRKSPENSLSEVFSSNQLTPLNIPTFIAGIPHRLGKDIQINSILSQGQTLQSLREPMNQHDKNAVKLMANGSHIGYIPKDVNSKIAQHLDSGKKIIVIVTSIDASDLWRGVRIKVSFC
jgi:hypothetical protein